jgi:septal ring factor EnvC (AmiA/AmiB activator)
MDKDLEFLLNSEFTENYRNEELKSFLSKFKYYFRLVWSQSQTRKVELENMIQKLEKQNSELKSKISQSEVEISRLKSQISDIKGRSLLKRILNRN